MRIAVTFLILALFLYSAALTQRVRNLRQDYKILEQRIEVLQKAAEQRDKALQEARSELESKKATLDEARKANPAFFDQPLPADICGMYCKGSDK